MRKLVAFCALALLALGSTAVQAQDKPKAAMKHEKGGMDHMAGPWKEMNAFHTVLGATFHPAADKKDTKPLRAKADELASTARAWTASTPPAACNSDDVKSTVAAISTDALAIGNQVLANVSDADLTKSITALHDKFEMVEKKCGGHNMKGMKH